LGQLGEAFLQLARWAGLGAVLIASGAGLFLVVVWNQSAAVTRAFPVETAFRERWKRLVVISWLIAAVASIPLLIEDGPLGWEALRFGLVLLGGLAWLIAARGGWPHRTQASGILPPLLGLVALLALLFSAALSGHARGSSLPLPNLLVALVHVAAAAAWVGGLVTLLAVAFPAVREQGEFERAGILAPTVARFSDLAVLSVIAIVSSGMYSAWMEIQTIREVTASTYGLVFLAKLAAFVPVLALGGVNNRWTKPRLLKAARNELPARSSLVLLRRLVALEITLIAVVLALTVFLLELSPPALG
jgi:putative copper export protein